LINLKIPEGPFIVLESLVPDKNGLKMIYTITPRPNKNSLKLGRGHESEVRIGDISVSRIHAIIKFENNKFIIEDPSSKFGSLKLIKNSIEIRSGTFQYFQVGRTLIKITLDKPEVIYNLLPGKDLTKSADKGGKEVKSPNISEQLPKNAGDDKIEDSEKLL